MPFPPVSQKDFAAALAQTPADASKEEKLAMVKQILQPGLLSKAWDTVNRPIAGTPDALVPALRHTHSEDESAPRKAVEDLAASQSSPFNLGLLATGVGAGIAGKAGKLGISSAARLAEGALQAPLVAEGIYHAARPDASLGERLGGALEGGLGAHGMTSAASHAFDPKAVVETYMQEHGLTPQPRIEYDPNLAKVIADKYGVMVHNPSDPAVKASYGALNDQVQAQHDFLVNRAGVKLEKFAGAGEPYPNSQAMVADVKGNNHLYYLPTDKSLVAADHPMMQGDLNDQFRAVHDYFGHAAEGGGFGPKGEEAAFQAHRETFTPEARGALQTETQGQNSWVNSGKHLRNSEGVIPSKGQPGYVPLSERPFAKQKAGLLASVPPSDVPLETSPGSPSSAATPLATLQHRSSIGGLTELDPAKYGTGQPGAELRRQASDPQDFVGRTYFTREGGFVEPRFQKLPHVYETSLPESHLYDLGKDPGGFGPIASAQAGMYNARAMTLAEKAIKGAGYKGYYNSTSSLPDAVALFHKTPVSANPLADFSSPNVQRMDASKLTKDQFGELNSFMEKTPGVTPAEASARIKAPAATALAIASPVASASIDDSDPNDPHQQLKHYAKLGLDLAGIAGFGAAVRANVQSPQKAAAAKGAAWMMLGGSKGDWAKRMVSEGITAADVPKIRSASEKILSQQVAKSETGLTHVKSLVKMFTEGKAEGDWYNSGDELTKHFGKDAPMVANLIAATSNNSTVKSNLTLALKVYAQHKANPDLPIEGIMKTLLPAISKATAGEELGGRKVNNFAKALLGDPNAVVVDRWMMRAFGFKGDVPTPTQYDVIEHGIQEMAKRQGVTPREAQAALWFGAKKKLEGSGRPESPPYGALLKGLFEDDVNAQDALQGALQRWKAQPKKGFGDQLRTEVKTRRNSLPLE